MSLITLLFGTHEALHSENTLVQIPVINEEFVDIIMKEVANHFKKIQYIYVNETVIYTQEQNFKIIVPNK